MSRTARLLGATMIPALAVPVLAPAATATIADVPAPPTNPDLPRDLDIASPYVPQTVCDPDAKPGVLAFARLMTAHYGRSSYGVSRACTYGLTEHSEGRALDWMLNAYDAGDREVADAVLAWLLAPDDEGRPAAMARRFGIMYIIWDSKIWGTYDMGAGWRPYRGDSPHTDHIHFSFSWDGAMSRTSWWTGAAWTTSTKGPGGPIGGPTNPTPQTYPTLRQGDSGEDVALAQKVIGVSADGQFGPATLAALQRWQSRNGVPSTGVLDKATWDRMVALKKIPARGDIDGGLTRYFDTSIRLGSSGAAVTALQKTLGISADGQFGPATDQAVRAFQRKKALRVDGFVTNNVWRALAGLDYQQNGTKPRPDPKPPTSTPKPPAVRTTTEYEPLKSQVLAKGARGAAVKSLQRALGGIAVDGSFGAGTEKALRSFQWKAGVRTSGVASESTWQALEKRDYPLLQYRRTVLRTGSAGYPVTVLQRYLGISADGQYGQGTADAVRALQGRHGLARTGYVGGLTWQALEREVRAKR